MKTLKQIHEGFYKNTNSGILAKKGDVAERLKSLLRNPNDFFDGDTPKDDYVVINDDLTVDIIKHVPRGLCLTPDEKGLGLQFGIVNSDIYIGHSKASNLTGLPINCDSHLGIEYCDNLQYISDNEYGCGSLYISDCGSLKSIKGMQQSIKNGVKILNCKNLASLEGCAKSIDGDLEILGCGLTTLKGFPKMSKGSTCWISCNDTLKSTKYLPKGASTYNLDRLVGITKLEDCPNECENFICSGLHSLTSLDGAPRKITDGFSCEGCKSITTLVGGPEYVGDLYRCKRTSITSLEGIPNIVGELDCERCNELISLEGFPEIVKGDFRYYGCDKLKPKKPKVQDFVKGKMINKPKYS